MKMTYLLKDLVETRSRKTLNGTQDLYFLSRSCAYFAQWVNNGEC